MLIPILQGLADDNSLTMLTALKQVDGDASKLPGSKRGAELIKSQVLPSLQRLQKDQDADVRHFADVAAQEYKPDRGILAAE